MAYAQFSLQSIKSPSGLGILFLMPQEMGKKVASLRLVNCRNWHTSCNGCKGQDLFVQGRMHGPIPAITPVCFFDRPLWTSFI